MSTNIIAKFDLEGFHHWPGAPDTQVAYDLLRSEHGHIFHFEVYVRVTAADRQIEFLEFRRQLVELVSKEFNCDGGLHDFGHRSCEMLAYEIRNIVFCQWKTIPSKVVVMEDQFVGAEVIR